MTRQGAEAHWLYIIRGGEADVRVAGEDGLTHRDRHGRTVACEFLHMYRFSPDAAG
jgi:hypothetical protein